MMAGDVFKLRVVCWSPVNGQIGVNVSYWVASLVTGIGATPAQFAAAFDGLVFAAYQSFMSSTCAYRGVGVQQVLELPPVEATVVTHANPGTAALGALPLQVSGLLGTGTAFSSRHTRGRIYIPFPADDFTDANGDINIAGQTILATLANAYGANLNLGAGANTAVMNLTVRSKVLHLGPPVLPPTITYNVVTVVTARTKFATQRRRGQYGRLNPLPF